MSLVLGRSSRLCITVVYMAPMYTQAGTTSIHIIIPCVTEEYIQYTLYRIQFLHGACG